MNDFKKNKPETLENKKIRLAKVMAECGVASRRQAETIILQGLVRVNGALVTEVTTFVDPDKDIITVNNKQITQPDRLRIWRYYKPAGVITTHHDPEGRTTVFDEAKKAGLPHVVSVGRLDINSEGLILLTNQGRFAHFAESPKTGWTRCYRVRVFGDRLPVHELLALQHGITIDGMHYDSITVDFDESKSDGRNHWLMMTLTEGKNREIRKIMNHLDLSVNRLIRVSYGPFALENLKPGMFVPVPGKLIDSYFSSKY